MVVAAPQIPVIPETAPFTQEQRAWLNGFIAGMLAKTAALPGPAGLPLKPLTIFFGSQTGTAEALGKRAAKIAGQRGFAATAVDMAQVDAQSLPRESNVLVITSTHGDGDPPDNAKAFLDALKGTGAPRLQGMRFSVCGLGDTNYVRFCQAAKDFDEALEKLGSTRVALRMDCDIDYEKGFNEWLDRALESLGAPCVQDAEGSLPGAPIQIQGAAAGYTRKNPFHSPVVASRTLSGTGSGKQVQHVEFSLSGSGMVYEAGDALGVWPQNCPELVAAILGRLGCDGEEAVSLPDGSATSFRLALSNHCDLGKPSPELAARFAAPAEPRLAAEGPSALHVIDLVAARPETRLAPSELVRLLRPLAPRLYSISSSPKAHADRVHVTVAAVRYEAHGRSRKGACSTFLSDRLVTGETHARVFVHSNPLFRPPAGDVSMIMVGPGTGIAPFRAFLHERKALGAKGKSWLFFGDQRSATDFLYEDELAELKREGVLTRLDTAFSREQDAKIYVQHRMSENAGELFAWLEDGAHFYVCGDASRMAKDVEETLLRIVAKEGSRTASEAADYLQVMRAGRRYCRDVY